MTANDGALGEQHLRDFQDNEKTIPTILTTSQKLSTGVDARNIRNIVLMRPINSMIEFKQIIGRGTRLYDGKDYFTIYDFVKAHQHFNDPEWDGEPLEPEDCPKCGQRPCVCERPEPKPCPECGQRPCVCLCPNAGSDHACANGRRKAKVKTRRRQGADDSAHDGDQLLAPGRHAHVGPAVHGIAVRQAARVLQGRSGTASHLERPRHPRQAAGRAWPKRDSAPSRWPRCSGSSTPRKATCSTCWPTSPTRCRH